MRSLKTFSVFFFLIFCLSFGASAQRFLGAFSFGGNVSQVDGDEVYGYRKYGFNFGPSVIMPFGKDGKFSVTMELLFSQLGAYQKGEYSNDTLIDTTFLKQRNFFPPDGYNLRLNYVQIPVIVHYTDNNVIAAGIGLQYGQLLSFDEWEDLNDARGLFRTDTANFYNSSDLEVVADARLRIYKRLWLNFRYSYSLFSIRPKTYINPFVNTSQWTRQEYNNVISFRLVYIFNEKLTARKVREQ